MIHTLFATMLTLTAAGMGFCLPTTMADHPNAKPEDESVLNSVTVTGSVSGGFSWTATADQNGGGSCVSSDGDFTCSACRLADPVTVNFTNGDSVIFFQVTGVGATTSLDTLSSVDLSGGNLDVDFMILNNTGSWALDDPKITVQTMDCGGDVDR